MIICKFKRFYPPSLRSGKSRTRSSTKERFLKKQTRDGGAFNIVDYLYLPLLHAYFHLLLAASPIPAPIKVLPTTLFIYFPIAALENKETIF